MIELVAIGDEVLYGYRVNSNAAFLANHLLEQGFITTRHQVVGDTTARVTEVLTDALKRGSCVIVTGGLGPTVDDLTRRIAADLFQVALTEPKGLRDTLTARFGKDFITLEDQVLQPEGAVLFENRLGTASGFVLANNQLFPNAHLVCLPGVSQEMKAIFSESVLPYLVAAGIARSDLYIERLHFHTIKEPEVDAVLRDIHKAYPSVSFGIYPGYSTLSVHIITAHRATVAAAKKMLLDRFQAYQFQSASATLTEAVHDMLLAKKITLSLAESCTGGALAHSFIQHAGASGYFVTSIVAYSNAMKEKLLGVDPSLLDAHGAVSVEVTHAMASGVKSRSLSSCSIAVSGILGPEGGAPQKPVGTVCATIMLEGVPTASWTMHLRGNREAILEQTVQAIHARLFALLSC